jgi:16S rRNA processing protein RimM
VAVGRITRAHGVKGEVAVLPLSEVPSRFEPGSRLVANEDPSHVMTVVGARRHRDRVLVTFEGVRDRDAAASLRGTYLFVEANASPDLPEGQFWSHRIVGAEVVTESGRTLGALREVIHTPANDLWVAVGPDGQVTFVPALKDVVVAVDLDGRRVTVRDVPGLTSPGT